MTEAGSTHVDTAVEDRDHTVYWTLSLYVDADNVPDELKRHLDAERQLEIQSQVFKSLDLRNAIEPMFNDIADRERLGVVEDFLLDVDGPREGETIQLRIPGVVEWSTEGRRFSAELGQERVRTLRMRTFWYVHVNGALSYHASFSYRYTRGIDDYYFISLLQKLGAPKEYVRDADAPWLDALTPNGGVFPLDKVDVIKSGGPLRFWRFIADRFNKDVAGLLGQLKLGGDERRDYFKDMVRCEPLIETAKLNMPRCRSMFVFDDSEFVKALLPKDAAGAAETRTSKVIGQGYGKQAEAIRTMSERKREGEPVPLDRAFLDDVSPEHLKYLFLAGFNQNIIDFLNQEAHEVLDSLDPVYPLEAEQEAESFFVRYANPRAFITYASGLRSLYLGNNYIGTCPYAFLIHVLAMHNEYMVRNYEKAADKLVKDTRGAKEKRHEFSAAAKRFHKFRKEEYANYYRYRAQNVFRYDTEQKVFEKLEERRGTKARVEDVERTFDNVENFTRDLESDQRQSDSTLFAWIGSLFVFCEVGFLLGEKAATIPAPGWLGGVVSLLPPPVFWNQLVLAFAIIGAFVSAVIFALWLRKRY